MFSKRQRRYEKSYCVLQEITIFSIHKMFEMIWINLTNFQKIQKVGLGKTC